MSGTYKQFFEALGQRESSGNYKAVNQLNFLGKYQFGEAALQDLGYVKGDGNPNNNDYSGGWTGLNGVNTKSDFLNNPSAQEEAMARWAEILWNRIRVNNLEFYNKQILDGQELSKTGMIGGSHLVGTGNLITYIQSGGTIIPKDGNGTPITEYLELFRDYSAPASFLDNLEKNNVINGGSQNDVLYGNAGNDKLNGNGGLDTAIFDGDKNASAVSSSGGSPGSFTVKGPDGSDTTTDIEHLQFADGTLVAGAANFAPLPTDADAVAEVVLSNLTGIELVDGSANLNAASSAVSLYDGSIGALGIGPGILLTSGDGSPPLSNTASNYSVDLGRGGDADLGAVAKAAFAGSGATSDASTLSFSFEVIDKDVNQISLDVVFGSDEYPEYSNTSFVDVGAVFINGKNYALFKNNAQQPLSIIDDNLAAGNFHTGLPIEYDGVSSVLNIVAPVKQGINTIKIGVADTGDHIFDSGIFVSNLKGIDGGGTGGIFLEVLGTQGNDNLVGTDVNEFFKTFGGNDLINVTLGNDKVDAGDGDDIIISAPAADNFIDGGAGKDTVDFGNILSTVAKISKSSDGTITVGTNTNTVVNVEFLKFSDKTLDATTLQPVGGLQIIGTAAGETLNGTPYNDTIFGRGGADRIIGNSGNDGLFGEDGNDTLEGGSGADTVSGGNGSDTILGQSTELAGDTVTDFATGDRIVVAGKVFGQANVSLSTASGVTSLKLDTDKNGTVDTTLSLTGTIAAVTVATGSDGNSTVITRSGGGSNTPTPGPDNLTGTAGNDSIDALAGDDTIRGGDGNDTLWGREGADRLFGENGDDVLAPGIGNDTVDGGAGTDIATFFDATAGVTASLVANTATGGAGSDTLANIENLAGGVFGDTLTGNAGNNTFKGADGNDTLAGGAGNDQLEGGNGNDRLLGEAGNDSLTGAEGADSLLGGEGADYLTGGNGVDRFGGGNGNDRFDFNRIEESGLGAARDIVQDFKQVEADKIDLATLDANVGVAGDQAFAFRGTGALTGAAQVRYLVSGGITIIQISNDADAAAEMEIQLTGALSLVAADLVL